MTSRWSSKRIESRMKSHDLRVPYDRGAGRPGGNDGSTSLLCMFSKIIRARRRLRPAGVATPLQVTCLHIGPVSYTKQNGTLRAVGILVQLSWRMNYER